MRVVKTRKQKSSFLLRIAIFAFSIYILTALVNQQVQIAQKSQQLDDLSKKIQVAEVQNDEIRHVLEDSENQSDEYIEQYVRRELGYAKPGERIFVNIAGN